MSEEREVRTVFGEVAEQYDAIRPSYPAALFDTVMMVGDLRAGDTAVEIGAGTGKATMPFLERGIEVHCLEPSPGMAALLRSKGPTSRRPTSSRGREHRCGSRMPRKLGIG